MYRMQLSTTIGIGCPESYSAKKNQMIIIYVTIQKINNHASRVLSSEA